MDAILNEFANAQLNRNGYILASTLQPTHAYPLNPANRSSRLYAIARSSSNETIQADIRYATQYNSTLNLSKVEALTWLELYTAFYRFVPTLLAAEEATNQGRAVAVEARWNDVYGSWKDIVNILVKSYSSGALRAWTIPCLYMTGKWLRIFAIKADDTSKQAGGVDAFAGAMGEEADGLGSTMGPDGGESAKLEDCARVINRLFGLCLGDRAPLEDSRKWGIYAITNLLFKTYFKLNSTALCNNILRSLEASTTDMPPLSAFPKSHAVTFNFYKGVLHFLKEDYPAAEECLTTALQFCPRSKHLGTSDSLDTASTTNRQLILSYLIPTRLMTTRKTPSLALLRKYPYLNELFTEIILAIRQGNLAAFDRALESNQNKLVQRRVYLTLERARDIVLCNLFRKVFLAAGFEDQAGESNIRRTRIKIEEFIAGVRISLQAQCNKVDGFSDSEDEENFEDEKDEVESYIANCIYKGFMKGYISREHHTVVLSKGGAFPGTGI